MRTFGDQGDGPDKFTAWMKDGRIYDYETVVFAKRATGEVVADELTFEPNPVKYIWLLTRVRDRAGNAMRFEYDLADEAPFPVEYRVKKIEYTTKDMGAGSGTEGGHRFVTFDYEEGRPDATFRCFSGVCETTTHLLKRVNFFAPNPYNPAGDKELAWYYTLSYRPDLSVDTSRTLLESVAKCDGKEVCQRAKVFEWWQAGEPPQFEPVALEPAIEYPSFQVDETSPSYLLVLDANGDGLDDILYQFGGLTNAPPAATYLRLAKKNRFGEIDFGHEWLVTSQGQLFAAMDMARSRPVDVDGDGKDEIFAFVDPYTFDPALVDAGILIENGYLLFRWNDLYHQFEPIEGTNAFLSGDPQNAVEDVAQLIDADGDGQLDMFRSREVASGIPSWLYYKGSTLGFDDLVNTGEPSAFAKLARALDLDGDGRGELFTVDPETPPGGASGGVIPGETYALGLNDNGEVAVDLRFRLGNISFMELIDLNGDGLKDALYPAGPTTGNGVPVRMNVGTGFAPPVTIENAVWQSSIGTGDNGFRVADFDGDGAEDVLTLGEYDGDGVQVMRLHRSRRDSFLPAVDLGFESGFVNPTTGWATTKLGDFNGDGLIDVVRFVQTGTWTSDNATHPMLKLTALQQKLVEPIFVTDKLVAVWNEGSSLPETEVYYASRSAIDVEHPAPCKYPTRCIREPFPVVQMVWQSNPGPFSTGRWTQYTYEDPVTDVRGRGFLGFRKVRELDLQLHSETITTHHFSEENGVYAEAGLPDTVTHIRPIFPLPTDPANDHPELPTSGLKARCLQATYGHITKWTWPHVFDVEIDNIATYTWDQPVEILNGRPVLLGSPYDQRTETQSFSHDNFGNLTYESSVVSDVQLYSFRIAEYEIREDDWLIALPRRIKAWAFDGEDDPPAPRVTDFEYDERGLLRKSTVEPDEPELRLVTELVRTTDGLVEQTITTSETETRSTSVVYDPLERMFVRATTNDLGHVEQAVFHPGLGVVVATRDANGVDTLLSYDRFGRLRRVDPDGAMATTVSYVSTECLLSADKEGICAVSEAEDGSRTITYTDDGGRVWESGAVNFDGTLSRSLVLYNAYGQLTHQGRPFAADNPPATGPFGVATLGPATITQADTLGRPLTVTSPDNAVTQFEHTMFVSKATGPTGRVSSIKKDKAGRIVETEDVVDATHSLTTQYSYGPFEQPETITAPDGGVVSFGYDKLGRRTFLDDPDLGERTYEYSAFGELTRSVDSLHTVALIRDVLGRVTTRTDTHVEGGAKVNEVSTFHYDQGTGAIGRLSYATASAPDNTALDVGYDSLGRPIQSTWTVAGEQFTVDTTYDALGRPDLVRYPQIPGETAAERFALQATYKPSGHFKAVTRVGSGGAGTPVWQVEKRYADGQLRAASWENDVTEERTQEPETGRLKTLFVSGNANLFGLSYSYLPDGNIETRNQLIGNRQETFTYDNLNRLDTHATKNPGENDETTVKYEYDDINRLLFTYRNGTQEESFAHGNPAKPRVLTGRVDAIGGAHTYQPDSRGRQIKRDDDDIRYTSFDLPRSIEGPTGSAFFTYDPLGTRVRKETSDEETLTLGGLYERRTTAEAVTHVFYVHGAEGVVAQVVRRKTPLTATEQTHYLARDLHGSVGLVFDKNANEIPGSRTTFDPFGQRIDSEGKVTTNGFAEVALGFTGHRHDDDFGLVNMGGRIYDPGQRRFLTPDPFVSDPSFGPSYNRFAYVGNNPLAFTDPSGFSQAPTHDQPTPQTYDCKAPECFPLPHNRSLTTDVPPTIKPNEIEASTGREIAHRHGPSRGPQVADTPAFDADKEAAAEYDTSIDRKLLQLMIKGSIAKQGAETAGIDMMINTGATLGSLTRTLPFMSTQQAAEYYGPQIVAGFLDAPNLTGYRPLDIALHKVPIVRIGQGIYESGRLWMEGDYYASGYVSAGPQGEIAMAVFAGLMSAGAAGASAAGGPRAYSVAFEANLTERGVGSYAAHFAEANGQLLRATANPELAAALRQTLGPNFEGSVLSPSGRVLGVSPQGWTWHHVAESPGVLHLVPAGQHAPGSAWQCLLHPNGLGGMSIWGKQF